MGKSGAHWSHSNKQLGETVHARVYMLTRKRAIDIFNYVVDISPVDTGAYRASWQITEGSPSYYFVGRQPRGKHSLSAVPTRLPPPVAPTGLSTKFYRKFYVSNGAPYAYRLEFGWSIQAPDGVIREALKYA